MSETTNTSHLKFFKIVVFRMNWQIKFQQREILNIIDNLNPLYIGSYLIIHLNYTMYMYYCSILLEETFYNKKKIWRKYLDWENMYKSLT